MEYKHFSHHHTLTLYKVETGQHFQCHGCHLPCHDSIFACWSCNFFLHEHCGNANRYIKHPSHTSHPLVLFPTPTYCSGSFLCNACGAPGTTFSYCCPLCEIDLHVNCAFLPLKVNHNIHQHDLNLSVQPPIGKVSSENCRICTKELNFKHWYYFCDKPECDFRVHAFCATTEVRPGLYQDDQPDQSTIQIPVSNQNSCPEAPTAEDVLAEMIQIKMQLQLQAQMAQINQFINSAKP